ncbi:MAG TPA: phosphotransferase [Acidimicrobiales bacterium]|nr:phosphotransferase [Acidimicrobiales bacterium]
MTASNSGAYRLDPATVAAYLAGRGVLPVGPARQAARPAVAVEPLAGGVSNDILAVSSGGCELVVKQALPRLRVAEEWLATPERISREAAAIGLAGSICPGSVPSIVHLDAASCLLVMSRAARSARTWKDDLLGGRIDPEVAGIVGQLIGRWHAATAGDPAVSAVLGDTEAFVQLRIDPYHRTVAARHPDLARRIDGLAAALLDRPQCLVHGDLSPKNVLVDAGAPAPAGHDPAHPVPAGHDPAHPAPARHQAAGVASIRQGSGRAVWVIDWEVAHVGNPVFDLAFVLCHLRCKAARRPADAPLLGESGRAFLRAYAEEAPQIRAAIDDADLAAHTACLLLARVDGKSPVEYLDPAAQQVVRGLATELLDDAQPRLDAVIAT